MSVGVSGVFERRLENAWDVISEWAGMSDSVTEVAEFVFTNRYQYDVEPEIFELRDDYDRLEKKVEELAKLVKQDAT